MEQFKYEASSLTKEQLNAIENCKQAFSESIKRLNNEEDQRMQHYYDCVDDYSFEGMCSKANYMSRRNLEIGLQESIESIVRGGYILRTRRVNVLKEKSTGKIVATGVIDGKYQPYFIIKNGDDEVKFVGCAKQLSTYEKKGYLPYIQTITEKKKFVGYWKNGDRKYEVLEVVSIDEELSTEVVFG